MKNKSATNMPPDTKTDLIFSDLSFFSLGFVYVHMQYVFTQLLSLCTYSFILFTVFNINR